MKPAWKNVVFLFSFISCIICNKNIFSFKMPVLRAGSEMNSSPFCFILHNEAKGFSVELIKEITKIINFKLNIRLETPSQLKLLLNQNKMDILLLVSSNKKNVERSIPYISLNYSIFVRKCSNIRTISDASNIKLISYKSSFLLKSFIHKKTEKIFIADSPLTALKLLSAGYGDGVIMPHYQGCYLINVHKLQNLSFRRTRNINTELSFGVKKGNKNLLGLINQGILKLKTEGKYEQIYLKWFGKLDKRMNDNHNYLNKAIYIMLPAIILFLLVILWSWSLQKKVREKTTELTQSNCKLKEKTAELEESLKVLSTTQEHIVQMEKMAALGELVSGVAHEINTPVGIGVSAASHLFDNTNRIYKLFSSNDLSQEDLEEYFSLSKQVSEMILSNLNRATNLINNFKQLAVDRTAEKKGLFNLKKCTNEIVSKLSPLLIEHNHSIEILCNSEKEIFSYALSYSQIIQNLIMNSILHGFEGIKSGKIKIEITIEDNSVIIRYQDNGKGIEKKNIKKIFEPFYTTRRNKGGIGIGMNIIYNIVTQIFRGTIKCESDAGKGVEFIISFPIVLQ